MISVTTGMEVSVRRRAWAIRTTTSIRAGRSSRPATSRWRPLAPAIIGETARISWRSFPHRLRVRRETGSRCGKLRHEIRAVSPIIAGANGRHLEVAGLELRPARMLVVVLIAQARRRTETSIPVVTEILRTQALPCFFVRPQHDDGLPAPLDREVRKIIGVKAQAGVVEIEPRISRRSPVDDPP